MQELMDYVSTNVTMVQTQVDIGIFSQLKFVQETTRDSNLKFRKYMCQKSTLHLKKSQSMELAVEKLMMEMAPTLLELDESLAT